MSTKINLRIKHKQKLPVSAIVGRFLSGTTLFTIILLILSGGEFAYWQYLTSKSNNLAKQIAIFNERIQSMKDVEAQKSLVTVKTTELQKLWNSRFDYVTALSDVTNLFSHTITVTSIKVTEKGELTVQAKKSQELKVDPNYTLQSGITSLALQLSLNSSDELQSVIQNITSYKAKGLTNATVGNVTRSKDGGYEVNLSLTFTPKQAGTNL